MCAFVFPKNKTKQPHYLAPLLYTYNPSPCIMSSLNSPTYVAPIEHGEQQYHVVRGEFILIIANTYTKKHKSHSQSEYTYIYMYVYVCMFAYVRVCIYEMHVLPSAYS